MRSKHALALGILGAALSLLVAAPLAAQQAGTPITTLNTGALNQTQILMAVAPCSVTGTVKLDPTDKTNGATWYKGTVTFTAKVDLTGVMIYPHGHPYGCEGPEAFLTGVLGYVNLTKPEAKFTTGQSRSYSIRCATSAVLPAGTTSTTSIKHFTGGNPGWAQKSADCSGKHTFVN